MKLYALLIVGLLLASFGVFAEDTPKDVVLSKLASSGEKGKIATENDVITRDFTSKVTGKTVTTRTVKINEDGSKSIVTVKTITKPNGKTLTKVKDRVFVTDGGKVTMKTKRSYNGAMKPYGTDETINKKVSGRSNGSKGVTDASSE